jgi:2,3-bisphosphoglycerate-independent phosphoglycerate mutase
VNKLMKTVFDNDGIALITADHGNAEVMFDMQTGQIDKEHTSNPVPFIVVGKQFEGKNIGWQDVVNADLSLVQPSGILADISPTVLRILGLPQPSDMRGNSLL